MSTEVQQGTVHHGYVPRRYSRVRYTTGMSHGGRSRWLAEPSANHRRLSWRRGLMAASDAVMRLREQHLADISQPETDRCIY